MLIFYFIANFIIYMFYFYEQSLRLFNYLDIYQSNLITKKNNKWTIIEYVSQTFIIYNNLLLEYSVISLGGTRRGLFPQIKATFIMLGKIIIKLHE